MMPALLLSSRQALLHLDLTLRTDLGFAAGVGLAGQLHLAALERQVATGRGLRQAQLAIGIDLDIPGTGGHVAGQFYALLSLIHI